MNPIFWIFGAVKIQKYELNQYFMYFCGKE